MPWKKDLSSYISGLYEVALSQTSRPLPASVLEMSHTFNDLRRFRKMNYFSQPWARSAYLAYFAPRNIARMAFLLDQLHFEGHLRDLPSEPLVVDLGAGPLVGVAAYALRFSKQKVQFIAVDQSRPMLNEGRAYFTRQFPKDRMPVRIVSANMKGPVKNWGARQPAHLVMVGNVLNELGDPKRSLEQRINFLEQVQSFVRPGGYLLIVEPAQKVASQGLSLLRDTWRGGKQMSLRAPCMGMCECPMRLHSSSWCHTSFEWAPPKCLEELMKHLGFKPNPMSLSYLLWQKEKKKIQRSGLRLVSQEMKKSGHGTMVLGCNHENKIQEIKMSQLQGHKGIICRGRWAKKQNNGIYKLAVEREGVKGPMVSRSAD